MEVETPVVPAGGSGSWATAEMEEIGDDRMEGCWWEGMYRRGRKGCILSWRGMERVYDICHASATGNY